MARRLISKPDPAVRRQELRHRRRARCWEPKRLRTRLPHMPATLARHFRTVILRVKDANPWAEVLTAGHHRLTAPPAPT
jgi:hypothetical protein